MAVQRDNLPSFRSVLQGPLQLLDDYISLQLSFLGILFMVFGFFVQFIEASWTDTGVWSATFFLWGIGLFLFGLFIYGIIWRSHQGSIE